MSGIAAPTQEVLTQTSPEYKYFDPPMPTLPQEVLGLNTKAVLHLGEVVTALGVLPLQAHNRMHRLPAVVRVVPLLEELKDNPVVAPEDIRPYRRAIKRSAGLGAIDKLAAVTGTRGALNRRVEREFPDKASDMLMQTREVIAGLENEVDQLADIDNPKKQFVEEVNALAKTVARETTAQRDKRLHSAARGDVRTAQSPAPSGIKGLFVRAVRKVRQFFGWMKRKPRVNREITAYDAGQAIHNTLQTLSNDPETTNQFPLLSKFVLPKLDLSKLSVDNLAFMSPEIMNFLFSLSDNGRPRDLIQSLNRNPHELRFVTKFKSAYHQYSLPSVQYAARELLPAIRDVLPASGAAVRETYNRAQELVGLCMIGAPEVAVNPEKIRFRDRIRSRVKKLRRKQSQSN